jgi:hypothetical protein
MSLYAATALAILSDYPTQEDIAGLLNSVTRSVTLEIKVIVPPTSFSVQVPSIWIPTNAPTRPDPASPAMTTHKKKVGIRDVSFVVP